MADGSWEVPTSMDYHPCNTAMGMKDYVLEDITDQQQTLLNELLIDHKRENEKYLASHPEIRAIIALILRLVMKDRPKGNIHNYIGQFFVRPSGEIREEIEAYLAQRKLILAPNSYLLKEQPPADTITLIESVVDLPPEAEVQTSEEYIRDLLSKETEKKLNVVDNEDIIDELFNRSKTSSTQGDKEDPVQVYRFCSWIVHRMVRNMFVEGEEPESSLSTLNEMGLYEIGQPDPLESEGLHHGEGSSTSIQSIVSL